MPGCGRLERLKREAILTEGMPMMVIPSVGGTQETILLRLDLVGLVGMGLKGANASVWKSVGEQLAS
jgi:hypothetical protein